jgi:dihydroorotate dehydrogenase (fumarate)
MADLRTTYLGIELKNPVVPSASPLSRKVDDIKRMEEAGASAVVLYSLFEEQVAIESGEFSDLLVSGSLSLADAQTYFPHKHDYPRDPNAYVEHVQKAKEAVGIPIIASMNGTSKGGWLSYASRIEEAGADGLEINLYFIPTSDTLFGLDIETIYIDVLKSIKKEVNIPVAVKLSPFFTALPNFAVRIDETGADGLVLFNRFYQPDIDVETRAVLPTVDLSGSADIVLPLRWTAILFGQVDCSLALTGGIHTVDDVLKAVMAGADVANVCSVLIKEGVGKLQELVQGLEKRMDELGIESIQQIKGSMSLQEQVEPSAFERGSYIKLLQSYGRI